MTHTSYEINTWQSILWRLIITALLLLVLAGSSVSILNPINQESSAFNLVPVSQERHSALVK